MPIFLRAVDQRGDAAILRYYLYSDVPFDAVSAALKEPLLRLRKIPAIVYRKNPAVAEILNLYPNFC